MSVRTPVEAQEAARLLLRVAKWYVDFTEDQLERGAAILVANPAYREHIYGVAYARATAHGLGLLAASLTDARDVLALNDGEPE